MKAKMKISQTMRSISLLINIFRYAFLSLQILHTKLSKFLQNPLHDKYIYFRNSIDVYILVDVSRFIPC